MRAGIALYLALASADRLLEATVREAAMSSPEWWEPHHQLAKLQPGTSWFGPIGRAIARDIARAHGGDITLDTSPQEGLRARIRLPV